jgi:hypothetical protein
MAGHYTRCDLVPSAVFLSIPLFFMKNQNFAGDDAYASPSNRDESLSFDTLSRILVALMCAAILFFGRLLAPVELGFVIEELLGWCMAGLAAVVAFIVAVGLIERLTD